MSIQSLRTAYTLHCLRASLGGFKALPLARFARLSGFVCNL